MPDNVKDLIKERPYTIMMGDGIDDIKMISKDNIDNSIKIGFLEENIKNNLSYFHESFDIVCTDNCRLTPITKLIEELA